MQYSKSVLFFLQKNKVVWKLVNIAISWPRLKTLWLLQQCCLLYTRWRTRWVVFVFQHKEFLNLLYMVNNGNNSLWLGKLTLICYLLITNTVSQPTPLVLLKFCTGKYMKYSNIGLLVSNVSQWLSFSCYLCFKAKHINPLIALETIYWLC